MYLMFNIILPLVYFKWKPQNSKQELYAQNKNCTYYK